MEYITLSNVRNDNTRKVKPLGKLNVRSICLAVFLVLSIFFIIDYGAIFNSTEISSPERDIVHDENLGQISEFSLIIEKLDINIPVVPNVDGKDKRIYTEALEKGVAHYKNTALPNSGSNIVIFGHSSSAMGLGEYHKIFAGLNRLELGDEIKINFNQKEYKYLVSEKIFIDADDTSVILPTERERLTLLTCWPVGTAEERLAIIAKPI